MDTELPGEKVVESPTNTTSSTLGRVMRHGFGSLLKALRSSPAYGERKAKRMSGHKAKVRARNRVRGKIARKSRKRNRV